MTRRRGADVSRTNKRACARWGEALRNDPAYNANLSLDAEDFSLAWRPRVRKPWESS